MEQPIKSGGRVTRAKRSAYLEPSPSGETMVALDEWGKNFMKRNMDPKI